MFTLDRWASWISVCISFVCVMCTTYRNLFQRSKHANIRLIASQRWIFFAGDFHATILNDRKRWIFASNSILFLYYFTFEQKDPLFVLSIYFDFWVGKLWLIKVQRSEIDTCTKNIMLEIYLFMFFFFVLKSNRAWRRTMFRASKVWTIYEYIDSYI